ncbi:MAG: hypothetical protein JW759_06150 [Candidatus Coatesbacteria bacterium]|nr:hypothetical protein [Candidatus Coatesbacteria bacterium]
MTQSPSSTPRNIISAVFLLLFLVPTCLAQTKPSSVKADSEVEAEHSVVVFFTGNTYGTMGRSSCTDPQMGGFERRITFIRQDVKNRRNALLLDAGNLFNCNCEHERLKSRFLISALNTMGYDALALGPKDFTFGLDHLKALERKARFPFLCANLLDAKTRAPVFDSFMQRGTTQATILVTGLISSVDSRFIVDWTKDNAGNPTVELEEPVQALSRVLASQPMRASVVIVLAQMSLDEALVLAEEVPRVNLIILSDRNNKQDLTHGGTIIASVGTKSKSVTAATLFFNKAREANRYNVERFPIVEEMEHSYSIVRLYEQLEAASKSLGPADFIQPALYVEQSIYDEPRVAD